MRTRRGFARLVAIGVILVAGLVTAASIRVVRAPEVPATAESLRPWFRFAPDGARAEYRGMDFRSQRLRSIANEMIFTACDLRRADLSNLNLSRCSFWKCDLRGANLTGAILKGAYYDRHTRWPAGFDPQRAGARLVE